MVDNIKEIQDRINLIMTKIARLERIFNLFFPVVSVLYFVGWVVIFATNLSLFLLFGGEAMFFELFAIAAYLITLILWMMFFNKFPKHWREERKRKGISGLMMGLNLAYLVTLLVSGFALMAMMERRFSLIELLGMFLMLAAIFVGGLTGFVMATINKRRYARLKRMHTELLRPNHKD